jgi:hypothetical protein
MTQPTPITPETRRPRWLPIVALLAAAAVPYLNSLHGEFHFDDNGQIVGNENLASLAATLSHSPRGRLLTFITFFVNSHVHGLAFMPGWHAVNIAIHAGCVLAAYGAFLLMAGGTTPRWPWIAAILFAVHPLASEPVNYIQARAVSLYTLFTLGTLASVAWMCRGRGRWAYGLALACACVLGAAISKEVGAFFAVAVPILYLLCAAPRGTVRWRWILPPLLIVAAVLGAWLWHAGVLDGIVRRTRSGFFGTYAAAQMLVFWRYVSLGVLPLPVRLAVDHYVPTRPYHFADGDVALAAIALLALACTAVVFIRKGRGVAGFLLLLVPAGLAPYFIMPSLEMMVEYRFYLPLAGLCALAAMTVEPVIARYRRTGFALLAGTLVVLAGATWQRNTAWRTDVSLWEDAAAKAPRKARTVNALAWALLNDRMNPDPRRALELAIRSFDKRQVDLPNVFNPYMADTLAEAYYANGLRTEAVAVEQDILRRGGSDPFFRKQLEKFQRTDSPPRHQDTKTGDRER